ncbi:MAG: immunoglobulin domain-containing protein [Verrucomicrobiota bacterium]
MSLPLAAGVGNLALDPQILSDGVHVAETSPARAAGLAVSVGADIDGEPWGNPPSIGCDEWTPVPRIVVSPTNTIAYVSRRMTWSMPIAGQPPFAIRWFKNGQLISEDDHYSQSGTPVLVVNKFGPEHSGQYFVVASNAFGMATSKVAQVVIHCVDLAAVNPVPPYNAWVTAANTIQDAVDVAQVGDIVLVTNGVYASGGRNINGLATRVVIDAPITVMSVNGYKATAIQGQWDAATNGPSAVRCVYMNNGAVLTGFTIKNGATLATGDLLTSQSGGGIGSASIYSGATAMNCLLTNNAANSYGGGACSLKLENCLIVGNYARSQGGGVINGDLVNCTVAFNSVGVTGQGGGVSGWTQTTKLRNSIVWGNHSGFPTYDNYTPFWTDFAFSASAPLPTGASNRLADMSFVDSDFHIPTLCAYREAGSSVYASGEDMDGELWANPPSMGADEVVEANLTGPLSLSIYARETNTFPNSFWHQLSISDSIIGRVSRIDWNYGDGVIVTNQGFLGFHWWTNPGSYTVTSTAYNLDHPNGVSASVVIQVLPLNPPALQLGGLNSNGFSFSFEAQTNAYYTVQYATNLAAPITWQALKTVYFSPGGPTLVIDPAWTNAARFYRVLAW